ncbi:MAG: peptidylprolyl isomerase [Methylotenera sp.]|nr:MAG: peptidylprolyl isomerase [Methylotenera sp.]PPD52705.1 MAG: peptidylprolyl isomerase [Methylotenera sp.]
MLDSIRSVAQGWVGKALLALITIPFALFGIDSYLSSAGSNVAIAKVGKNNISIQAYDNALKNIRNRLQSEGKIDPAAPDLPEMKSFALNQLINDQLLDDEVKHANFAISDMQLTTYITGMPEFQKDGKFSQELYDQTLTDAKLTPNKFEARIRADLLAQQAQDNFAKLGFISNARAEQAYQLTNQQRVVAVAEIKTKDFVDQVKIEPAQVKAYYDQHKAKLMHPEQVKIEFLLLSAAQLITGVGVDDAEVRKFYDDNIDNIKAKEQRRASHILIGFGVNPTPEKKAEAKAKAEGLLAEIKKAPKTFEALAVKNSQDDESASKGGDLGVQGRGYFTPPVEKAIYDLKVNELSNLVESEYGYHIIKVTEVIGENTDFETLKPQIKGDLMFKKAQDEFIKQAEGFSELVYTQSNSLAPAAKAFGSEVQKSDWLTRESAAKFFKDNSKFVDLIFSAESLKDRRNTAAMEVSPNNLVSARVVDYKPATQKSFDEVKEGIEALLKLEAAAKLASTKGEAALKDLRAGKSVADLQWTSEVAVDRKNAEGLTELAMTQAFKTDVSKLPAYSGLADKQQGYLLVKVLEAKTLKSEDPAAEKSSQNELEAALESEYLAAYKQSLREKAKVTVNEKLLLGSTENN